MPEPTDPTDELVEVVDPRRSAHASIRGFLYQACWSVLRWLELGEGEVLVCEGDEDLDQRLLGQQRGELVQVKDLSAPVAAQTLRKSLHSYLVTYKALQEKGEERKYVFTTTAERRKTQQRFRGLDPLSYWNQPSSPEEALLAVREWLAPAEKEKEELTELVEALSWLDEAPERLERFVQSVEWKFGAPRLDALRDEIRGNLQARPEAASLPLRDAHLVDWLVGRVLDTSRHPEPADRVLTREDITALLGDVTTGLQQWAAEPRSLLLRSSFEELISLERLLEPGTSEPPAPYSGKPLAPGKLLTAAYEVVPFEEEGRGEELAQLAAWCDEERPRMAWLWTAEGGYGKTRLAIELCRRLRARGWEAGFLHPEPEGADLGDLLRVATPRLVVIDYAATRLSQVRSLLKQAGNHRQGPPRLRILLLARQSGAWWNALRSDEERPIRDLLEESPDPHALQPLVPDDSGPSGAFDRALEAFESELPSEAASPSGEPRPLKTPHDPRLYERALYLHMAALNEVLRAGHAEQPDAGGPLQETLWHERQFWKKQIADLRRREGSYPYLFETVERAVAVLTLVGGIPDRRESLRLFRAVEEGLERKDEKALLDLLGNLYGGTAEGRFLDPLTPDLLGEELVAQHLTKQPESLAPLIQAATEEGRRRALTVLARLISREGERAKKWFSDALASDLDGLAEMAVEVAVETEADVEGILVEQMKEASAALNRRILGVCDSSRYQNSTALMELALLVTERALRDLHCSESSTTQQEHRSNRARLLSHLGIRLGNLGRHEEALLAAQQAVKLRRALCSENNSFCPDLARSLSNLGLNLNKLGRWKKALTVAEEAVGRYRALCADGSNTFLPELANSLINLSINLHALGCQEDALAATQEAVKLYLALTAEGPGVHFPDLAMSLNSLGADLSALGRWEEAIEATQGAQKLYRNLYAHDPDVFRPYLAASLTNLGADLNALGRLREALLATQEGVDLYRRLALDHPEAFRQRLSMSLHNLGILLGGFEEALAAVQEAVELMAPLFSQNPEAFEDQMCTMLSNYRERCAALSIEPDEALIAPLEAKLKTLSEKKEKE